MSNQGDPRDSGEESPQGQPRSSRPIWLAVALLVAAAIAGGAVWGHLSGYGVFGYRLLMYGENNLYVLNLGDEERYVSIDGGELEMVGADGARLLPIVGGESKVEAFDADKAKLDSWTVKTDWSHALLSLSEGDCLAVSELDGLAEGKEFDLQVVDALDPGVLLYPLESQQVLWPRMDPGVLEFPDGEEVAISIEPADCGLLEDGAFLVDYLQGRIEERMEPPEP